MAKAQPPRDGDEPRRSFLRTLVYGALVLGVWGLIFLVAFFAVFAVDLPDTSNLYDVKRQPSVSYLDRSGGLLAVRGSQAAAQVDLGRLPAYVPEAFIAIRTAGTTGTSASIPGASSAASSTISSIGARAARCAAARPSPSSWRETSS